MRPIVEELDADVRELLTSAAQGVEPPRGAKQRVAESVAASALSLHVPRTPGTAARRAAHSLVTRTGSWALKPVISAFALGAIAGAAAYATLEKRPPERIVYIERVGSPAVSVEATPSPIDSAPLAGAVSALAASASEISSNARRTAPRGTSAQPSRSNALEVERMLLDKARRALGAGRSEDVLQAIGEHELQFPRGALVEEREALAVNALVLSHRPDEARDRADRFIRRFPASMLRPSVEAAIAAIR